MSGTLTSVVSGSHFLHAGGFGFGDVLVVGLVLQLSTEVLDGYIQSFLQGHLPTHKQIDDEDTSAARKMHNGHYAGYTDLLHAR